MGQKRQSFRKMKTFLIIPLLFVFVCGTETEKLDSSPNVRNPKLFLISTTTSTTTLSTAWNCYKASASPGPHFCTPGGRKKKRAALDDSIAPLGGVIRASKHYTNQDIKDDDDTETVDIEGAEREGKVFNYFMTATKTTTFYSYTATSTLASLICTPEGWTMPACPASPGK